MISVIIPVFNVAPFLDECIKSVVGQIYKDWECILVDDGSTDRSSEICDKWARIDKRIIVVHKQNEGVSVARNVGLEKALGEFITFVDSDDVIETTYLSDLIDKVSFGSDLVISGMKKVEQDGTIVQTCACADMQFQLKSEKTALFVELNKNFLLFGPVAKLYKTSIIRDNKIFFKPAISFGEDLYFNYEYLTQVSSLYNISKVNYIYYRRCGDSLSQKFREDYFEICYAQWSTLKMFYQRNDMWNECSKEYLYQRLWGIVYDSVFLCPKIARGKISYLRSILKIPEIVALGTYQDSFVCSKWIKQTILHRKALIFYLYFRLRAR